MSVELFLSPSGVASSYLPAGDLAGFDLHTQLVESDSSIIDRISGAAKALVIEVVADQPGSMNRLQEIIEKGPRCPILVAVESPSLDDVRTLMHEGVTDILPLPLTQRELEAALGRIKDDIATAAERSKPEGQIVSVAKCRGGVGATTIISQLAVMTAQAQGKSGDVCLVDLDVQFGNSALYLGKLPKTGVKDLLDAGNRADAAMLRSLIARHPSGLNYLAAPLEIMPLNAVDAEQIIYLLDLLASEYGTVFVDLPTDWTNWSLSTIARSDLVLLIGELSIASLHQAKRQIDFLRQQDLAGPKLKVGLNRVQKRIFKTVGLDDANLVLGRDVSFSVADDARTVQAALDQGVLVSDIDARSKVARDLATLVDLVPALAVAEA